MFASIALARPIELAKAGLTAEIGSSVSRLRPAERILVETLCGGVTVFGGDDSLLVKAP